jgi:hypothetical protein
MFDAVAVVACPFYCSWAGAVGSGWDELTANLGQHAGQARVPVFRGEKPRSLGRRG